MELPVSSAARLLVPEAGDIIAYLQGQVDYLCDDCNAHFQEVKARLDAAGIPYLVEPTIVRGLDYSSSALT